MIPMPSIILDYADLVFVKLGEGEVKAGKIGGVRVMQLSTFKPAKVNVELAVDRVTQGTRKQMMERFAPQFVFKYANLAFYGLPSENWTGP